MENMRCLFRIAIWWAIFDVTMSLRPLSAERIDGAAVGAAWPWLSLDGSSARLTKIEMKTQGVIEPDENPIWQRQGYVQRSLVGVD
jgi:hypothetical protein